MSSSQRIPALLSLTIAAALLGAACSGPQPPGGALTGAGPHPSSSASVAKAPAAPATPPPVKSVCSLTGLVDLPSPKLDRYERGPSRENLRAWVDTLTSPLLRGRSGGSVENKRVAAMLARELLAAGLSGPPSDGEMCRAFEISAVADQNVVAHFKIPGYHADTQKPVVIIGAHYDAQGVDAEGAIYPGADDNASGVAALMEIARVVALHPERAMTDFVFIAFGAEERGTLGARAYVEAPTVPLRQVSLMINLDMVGRQFLGSNPLRRLVPSVDNTLGYVVSKQGEVATEARLRKASKATKTRVVGIPESVLVSFGFLADSVMFSDHAPTLFLSTSMHPDYHRPTDTADKIQTGQIARAVRLVLELTGAGAGAEWNDPPLTF